MKKAKILISVLLLGLFLGPYSWPYWTGDLFYGGGNVIPAARVKLPSYYEAARSWLNNQGRDFNLMSLPLGIFDGVVLRWSNGSHGYFSINPDILVFDNPVIARADEANGIPRIIMTSILSNENFEAGDLQGWSFTHPLAVSVDSSVVHSGRFSALLKAGNGTGADLYTASVSPVPNGTITFSMFAIARTENAHIRPTIWFYNTSSFLGFKTSGEIPVSTRWNEYKFSALAPERASFYRVGAVVESPSNGTTVVNVDDFRTPDTIRITNFGRLLTLLNTRFVVYHNDTNWQFVAGHPWWFTSSPNTMINLISQQNLAFEKQFGQLLFFSNPNWMQRHVYATSKVHLAANMTEMLMQVQNDSYSGKSLFLISSQLKWNSLRIPLPVSDYEPDVQYERLDSSSFMVHVHNATHPFFLVLTELYDNLWSAELPQGGFSAHYIANSFANAWLVNTTGTYDIRLYFAGQTLLLAGFSISLLTLLLASSILVASVILDWRKYQIKTLFSTKNGKELSGEGNGPN